jgi:hypothetical protein
VLTGGGPIKNDLKKTVKNYVNVPPALLNAAVEEQPVQAPIPDAGTEPENSEASQPAEQTAPVDGQAAEAEAEEVFKAQERHALHARELMIAELSIPKGALIMNIRELKAALAAKIARARELADLADSESRDFTDEERAEYTAALAEASTQSVKITQIQTERDELQNVETLQAKLAEQKAEKPASGAALKTMTRSEFNKLSAAAQMDLSKAGGKIVD